MAFRALRKALRAALALVAAALVFMLCGSSATADYWHVETVADDWGMHTSLALDDTGNPHITYKDQFGDLKYAFRDESGWAFMVVDNDIRYTSLVLDAGGNPCISYMTDLTQVLKYASWSGSSWSIQTVDARVGHEPSLALDSLGNPHVSYYGWGKWPDYDLMCATWNGESWQAETVDSEGLVGTDSSLAIDANDTLHITYWDASNNKLKYAKGTPAMWQIETVDNDGDTGKWSSLALDVNGNPHIAYDEGHGNSLRYAVWDGASWQIDTVDNEGNVGGLPSLALDSNGNPRVAYYDYSDCDLMYAAWNGSVWEKEAVDTKDTVGWFCSLALDSDDNVHISYWDNTNSALKYATNSIPPPPPSGDANHDGKVDGIDLAYWQVNYDPLGENQNVYDMGDFNEDGKIDGGDLAIWQATYDPLGPGDMGQAASIPEPMTLVLLSTGIMGWFAATRRRRGKHKGGAST